MKENDRHNIPLEVIDNGRDLGAVLDEYRRIWDDIRKIPPDPGSSPDEIFANAMLTAAYRIYLFGLQDGMEAART